MPMDSNWMFIARVSGRKRLCGHMEVWFMCTWTHWELYYGTMVLLSGFLRHLKECLFAIQISLLFQHPSTHLSAPCWFLRAVYLKQWSHTRPGSEKSFIFLVWWPLSWSCHLPFCWPWRFCFPECHGKMQVVVALVPWADFAWEKCWEGTSHWGDVVQVIGSL